VPGLVLNLLTMPFTQGLVIVFVSLLGMIPKASPNLLHVVTVIRSLQEYLKTHGLDPVFNIVTATETIDMLEHPSLLTKPLIETWLKDLKTDGVHNGQGCLMGSTTVKVVDLVGLYFGVYLSLSFTAIFYSPC
jgi:hypothetical protein